MTQSSTPSRISRPSTRTCRGTVSMPRSVTRSGGRLADESVTTTTGIRSGTGLRGAHLGDHLHHRPGDGRMSLPAPMDTVRIRVTGEYVVPHGVTQIDQGHSGF